MKLSVCYIVKNEIDELRKSLASIAAIADEIVITNTGSEDNICALAKEFGAVCLTFPWCDDFSAARNFTLDHSTGDWVLFLDADEYFVRDAGNLRVCLETATKEEKDVYLILVKNISQKREEQIISQFYAPRLFRGSTFMRYQGRIHEQISAINGSALQVGYMDSSCFLYHTGYGGTGVMEKKLARNLKLLKQSEQENPTAALCFYLADCYYGLRDYAPALQYAQRYLTGSAVMLGDESSIYRIVLNCMRELRQPDAAMLPYAEQAIEKYPELPDYYGEKGMILCGLGRLEEARRCLIDALIRYEQKTEDSLRYGSYFNGRVAALVCGRLAEIASCYGDRKEKAFWLQKAAAYQKSRDQ